MPMLLVSTAVSRPAEKEAGPGAERQGEVFVVAAGAGARWSRLQA